MKTHQDKGHEHDGHGEVAVQQRHGGTHTAQRSIPAHPPVRSVAVWGPIAVVSLLALLVIFGVWRHMRAHGEQQQFAKETNQLAVNVIDAQRDLKPKELILPGTFQAIKQTTIYPRSNGYVESWKVDIGDNVQAGQSLAGIAKPEGGQQIVQARAQGRINQVTARPSGELVQKNV